MKLLLVKYSLVFPHSLIVLDVEGISHKLLVVRVKADTTE